VQAPQQIRRHRVSEALWHFRRLFKEDHLTPELEGSLELIREAVDLEEEDLESLKVGFRVNVDVFSDLCRRHEGLPAVG